MKLVSLEKTLVDLYDNQLQKRLHDSISPDGFSNSPGLAGMLDDVWDVLSEFFWDTLEGELRQAINETLEPTDDS